MELTRTSLPVDDRDVAEVTAVIHRPVRPRAPGVLLTHGAGGDLDGAGLIALAEVLSDLGHVTVRANLPYREAGRKAPPRAESSAKVLPSLVEAARDAVVDAEAWAHTPWILGGKSYGGRVASLAVAGGLDASGLLFYGYPLHPPGKPERLRVDHWPAVQTPTLFLQGTRDTLCDLELLTPNLHKLPRRATLHVVEGGDHSLDVTAKASPDGVRRSAAEVIGGLRPVVEQWIGSVLADPA